MLEITEGEEYRTPKELSKCTFHLVLSKADAKAEGGWVEVVNTRTSGEDASDPPLSPVSYQIDEDEGVQVLGLERPLPLTGVVEAALKKMKKGGECELSIAAGHAEGDAAAAALALAPGTPLKVLLVLLEFDDAKEAYTMNGVGEKLEAAEALRKNGNVWFKKGELARALRRYESARKFVEYLSPSVEDEKEEEKNSMEEENKEKEET